MAFRVIITVIVSFPTNPISTRAEGYPEIDKSAKLGPKRNALKLKVLC